LMGPENLHSPEPSRTTRFYKPKCKSLPTVDVFVDDVASVIRWETQY
jgi:hypothetical protein